MIQKDSESRGEKTKYRTWHPQVQSGRLMIYGNAATLQKVCLCNE